MKINIVRIIIITLLIGTFFIIFGFSSQNGEESSGISGKITKLVVQQLAKDKISENEKGVERVIRKIAHFSIYTLVGLLLMAFMSTYSLEENRRIVSSFIIGVLYATSDEIHQKFVPGRSCQLTDVMIDSMGVLLGIILFLIVLKIYKKRKKKTEDKKLAKSSI